MSKRTTLTDVEPSPRSTSATASTSRSGSAQMVTSDARGTLYVCMPDLPNVQTIVASAWPCTACLTLSASSGPSTMMIGPPLPMRMTLPTSAPREYFEMPLCSRLRPSCVSSTLWMPCTSPFSLTAGKMIAGPSYTFGLNRAMSVAVLARRLRLLRYSSAGRTASMFSRVIGTLRSHVSLALRIFCSRVSSSLVTRSFDASRVIRRSNSDGVYGTASEFSKIFGFSPPRFNPLPMVDLISMSFSPACRAAECSSMMAASSCAGARCAWRPSVNAALFSVSLRPPFVACMTSVATFSRTLWKYASDISSSRGFLCVDAPP